MPNKNVRRVFFLCSEVKNAIIKNIARKNIPAKRSKYKMPHIIPVKAAIQKLNFASLKNSWTRTTQINNVEIKIDSDIISVQKNPETGSSPSKIDSAMSCLRPSEK